MSQDVRVRISPRPPLHQQELHWSPSPPTRSPARAVLDIEVPPPRSTATSPRPISTSPSARGCPASGPARRRATSSIDSSGRARSRRGDRPPGQRLLRRRRPDRPHPIDQPEVDIDAAAWRRGRRPFTATVAVRPEVTLGAYTDYPFTLEVPDVTDEQVERRITELRQEQATLRPIDERPAARGDVAAVKFVGTIDGEPFEGGIGRSSAAGDRRGPHDPRLGGRPRRLGDRRDEGLR